MTYGLDRPISRRTLLKGMGALVVTLSLPQPMGTALARTGTALESQPRPLAPDALDTWLAIAEDGHVTAYFGKMDMGQGVDTAIAQFVADELDVPLEKVSVVMGDTAFTVNQGGASSATGIETGSVPIRNAAAEARRILLEMAAERFQVPVERLTVSDGVISVTGDPSKRVTYGELIGGRRFNVNLEWNGQYGNSLNAWGKAKPKTPDQFKVVGTSVPRRDIPPKVFGQYTYVVDVKVPGMLHGRMLRPPVAGARPISVDESSIRDIPGARVVRKGDLIGVVAETEWDAIKAARQLRVTWSDTPGPFIDMAGLYDYIRSAPSRWEDAPVNRGDVDRAFAQAVRVIEREYELPFQTHASMGPACAVADVRDGEVTVWTGSQKPHYTAQGIAKLLGFPEDKVRGIWVHGPGSYGRNEADDAAYDAAVLSQMVGRPVRVQYMRDEAHAWGPKGPAAVVRMRAGISEAGEVIAWEFDAKGFSAWDVRSNASDPSDTLTGQLLGITRGDHNSFGVPQESYGFPNKRMMCRTIHPFLKMSSPLRTAHFRDPQGPQVTFASESFVDEVAAELGVDPVEFRLRYITDPRHRDVVQAAARRAGWQPRPSPRRNIPLTGTVTGRGFAYALRKNTVVAVVCDVEVDTATGRIWPRRFTVAHDCGLVVNPESLRVTIEGNLLMGTSRALWEEVRFDRENVRSVDWSTYPILEATEVPEVIDIELINRPDLPPYGAGEPATRLPAAAIANAVFDATGVRLRRVPFTPDAMKAALERQRNA